MRKNPVQCKMCSIKITGERVIYSTTYNDSGLCNYHEAMMRDDTIFETVKKFRDDIEKKGKP